MDKLFLLKPGFGGDKIDTRGKHYYCLSCSFIEGIVKNYLQLETLLDIDYVDIEKPGTVITEPIGKENQACPGLINKEDTIDTTYFKPYNDTLFINSAGLIAKYFSDKYKIGLPYPQIT